MKRNDKSRLVIVSGDAYMSISRARYLIVLGIAFRVLGRSLMLRDLCTLLVANININVWQILKGLQYSSKHSILY